MPKNKVSEWSATASNNTDIGGINIAEGCAPSGINNAIRELMAQVKDMQSGTDADTFTVGGNLTVSSTLTANSSVGTAGQALVSRGSGASPQWSTMFVTGMIMMWSGTIATIPSGWVLCNGSNGTPDLRNRFIIGANADDGGAAKTNVTGSATQTGGTKDAIVVSHTHSVTDPGHLHTVEFAQVFASGTGSNGVRPTGTTSSDWVNTATTGISIDSTGSSGTNQNLPPYYALAFIMKS
jgi:hypothetical protein